MVLPSLSQSKDIEEISRLESSLVEQVFRAGNVQSAWDHLYQALLRLMPKLDSSEYDGVFIKATLQLAQIGFVLGKKFNELIKLLKKAQKAAMRHGDRRSHCMINLHLGRLYYLSAQRLDAMDVFAVGKMEAEGLGDDDILSQASEFIGLYYFIQGLFIEAKPYLEEAAHIFESEDEQHTTNHSGPIFLGLCYSYLGEYHRAIGTLDYFHRLALNRSDKSMAALLQAILGVVLATINQEKEARFHSEAALLAAKKTGNKLAEYFAHGGPAVLEFHQGNLRKLQHLTDKVIMKDAFRNLTGQYASPIVLEILFRMHMAGILYSDPNISFYNEVQRCMTEHNIHLRGVALRLKAMDALAEDGGQKGAASDLFLSEEYLTKSGDPIQLAKTHLEIARLKLRRGDQDAASVYAQKAWKGFSGYTDLFYPDDLMPLLADKKKHPDIGNENRDLLPAFVQIIEEVVPTDDVEQLFTRMVANTNRFFGAERGALFWFGEKKAGKRPEVRAAHNLLKKEVSDESFRSGLSLVFQAFREKRPIVVRNETVAPGAAQAKALLCVPIEVSGQVKGVLYHDNSYINYCFDEYTKSQLFTISNTLSTYIGKILNFGRGMAENTLAAMAELGGTDTSEIISKNPGMLKVLAQSDQVAATDSTVMILGETGVGKELLARRIHRMSHRKNKPLVVIDPTALPENLVESELFGHEKGAFTGADRQKKGRMELAHQGTLFIDEVGEIPKHIQPKLLRALQEKTTVRIGGAKNISSDYRLIVATNRDLAEEVAAGRFREDLYYRLNVIPLTLPPLRDRPDDIPLLARHFLDRYSAKYNRPQLNLTDRDEAGMMAYHWPGNVRELNNVMERAVLLSTEEHLELNLPVTQEIPVDNPFEDLPTFREIQRRYIRYVLEKTNGKIGGPGSASEILDMNRGTLYNCMKRIGLR